MKRFAVFIASNGRPNSVKTYETLRRQGYTGDIYIVCDNLDDTLGEYQEKFGDKVIVFDKEEYRKSSDTMDNFETMGVILYARNAIPDIARDLGLDVFLVLDDDYVIFRWKYVDGQKLRNVDLKNLDKTFDICIRFLYDTDALTVACAQGGDFIGGIGNPILKTGIKRKAMNTFFIRTDKPFKYRGTINEDVNTYTVLGSQGELFLTFKDVVVNQQDTQANVGGMTETYLDVGTYFKSFYSVIGHPSSVTIRTMGDQRPRIHHSVAWRYTVPEIVHEKHKK